MSNRKLIRYLESFRNDYENSDDPVARYKIRAYDKVIAQIEDLPYKVRNLEDLSSVEGIGKRIRDKLQDYFEMRAEKRAERKRHRHREKESHRYENKVSKKEKTTELSREERKKSELSGEERKKATESSKEGRKKSTGLSKGERKAAIEELLQVHGIGPVKARNLVAAGITSISKLKRHKDLLNDKQKLALKYVDTSRERIPRSEMKKHAKFLAKIGKKVDPDLIVEVVGSYRRDAPTSGDIDVLIADPTDNPDFYYEFVNKLREDGYLVDELAYGKKKFLGYCRLPGGKIRRIDLLFTPMDELAFAELYFTGSQDFNVAMRNIARDQGYRLSEHGLYFANNRRERVQGNFDTEEDVFDFLGMEYTPPEDR